jgi:hypothetical protein
MRPHIEHVEVRGHTVTSQQLAHICGVIDTCTHTGREFALTLQHSVDYLPMKMPLDIEAGVRETATGYLCLEDILQFRALFLLSLADFIDLKRPLHPALEREELELLKNLLALRLHHQPILMRTVQQDGFKSPNAVYAALRQRARPMVIDLRSQPRGYTRSAAAAAVHGPTG